MSLIQKYIWVVKTIHRAGRITLKELNEKWRNNVDLSRGEDLPRQTFDRWKGGILDMFGIVIECEAKDYFADFFGIVIDENVPLQRIVLRADKYHQYYMRTLPMHYSQRELFSCDDYADFELTLRPTYDFYMRLMSWGNMIKVLEPQSLQDELRKWLRKTMEVYE